MILEEMDSPHDIICETPTNQKDVIQLLLSKGYEITGGDSGFDINPDIIVYPRKKTFNKFVRCTHNKCYFEVTASKLIESNS